MSKWILRLVSLMAVIGLIAGCGSDDAKKNDATSSNNTTEQTNNEPASDEEKQETVVITISKDEGAEVITEKEIAIKENDILLDVMKENFDVEDEGGFITGIEGVAPEDGEQKAWMYFVNDEMAPVGANEFELTPGDKVTFDLQSWE